MGVHTLKAPVALNGKTYEALTYRRARGGDIRLLDRLGLIELIVAMQDKIVIVDGEPVLKEYPTGLIDKAGPFFARCCDVDEAVIDALDGEDYMALVGKLEEMMPEVPLSAAKTTRR